MSEIVYPTRYTQSDSRMLAGVKRESYRYWRETIPYLAAHRGANASLALCDILGLMVVRELAKTLSVNVGDYRLALNQLFDLLRALPDPLGSAPGFALISTQSARLISGINISDWTREEPVISVPLQPLAAELADALTAQRAVRSQAALDF